MLWSELLHCFVDVAYISHKSCHICSSFLFYDFKTHIIPFIISYMRAIPSISFINIPKELTDISTVCFLKHWNEKVFSLPFANMIHPAPHFSRTNHSSCPRRAAYGTKCYRTIQVTLNYLFVLFVAAQLAFIYWGSSPLWETRERESFSVTIITYPCPQTLIILTNKFFVASLLPPLLFLIVNIFIFIT